MEIRNLTSEDRKYKRELQKLIEIAFLASFQNLEHVEKLAEAKAEEIFQYLEEVKGECLICIEEGRLLGMCWYFFRKEAGEGICHISQMAVVKDWQGRGISTEFVGFLERICRERGVKRLELNVGAINTKGIQFYQKNNFVAERILMKKNLD